MNDAIQQIVSSRRFLKWTYAHGYIANYKAEKRKLFEFHQAQLEGTLERLCDIMENTSWDSVVTAISKRPFYDIRSKILSLTGVVRQFFNNLRDAFQSGTLLNEDQARHWSL